MTNPFKDKTPPELIAMVRGGAECEKCNGRRSCQNPEIIGERIDLIDIDCPVCNGTGKQPPLSGTDLDALAACVCDGEWVKRNKAGKWLAWRDDPRQEIGWWWLKEYTTDPREAMRLMVKYWLHIEPMVPEHADEHTQPYWTIKWPRRLHYLHMSGGRHDSFCHAATVAAVIAALAEVSE